MCRGKHVSKVENFQVFVKTEYIFFVKKWNIFLFFFVKSGIYSYLENS